ncbi:amino acid adenylation domain-containing protein [Methylobacterium sp. EM32]|uniref:amino acid adenylation domain-containing protein n=1 Tax=Methylobacterium sp. EM32 TaxID=3163481 RepID=UPI0033AC7A98
MTVPHAQVPYAKVPHVMQRGSFVDQFELQASLRPGAAALSWNGGWTRYDELDRGAERLARRLAASGLGRGAVAGLFLEAGADYVQALLGVGKAGAAFLPLPPDLPPRRLRTCLAKAACRVVVTDRAHRPALEAALAGADPVEVIGIEDLPALDAMPPVARRIGPADPCSVMFTSGSTGEPKAILGPHRSLAHFLRWETGEFALDSTTRGSWLAPITFDVSLRDILVPLMVGGTLCIPDPETRMVPRRLVDWLAREAVTLVHCVPTVLRLITRELADRGGTRAFPALRHLLVAGEPLIGADVLAWREAAGEGAEVVNLYGPSETTLAKVFSRVGPITDPRRVLPIGRPLPDTSILVLANGRACAPQQIGEIHIRTAYPSLGYLGDPEATRAAFVPNPLGDDPADLIYRTGDMGRLLPDGTVECLGRQDNQVKIGGVRIELGEVEAGLREVPGVGKAAAAVHTGAGDLPVLVGYVVPAEAGTVLDLEAIRLALAETLPAATRPRVLVPLKDLPTTVSGKLNRRALPRPEELFYAQHSYVAPEGETEEGLAAIWREIFGLSQVGAETGFHEFGGDSLRAIRAVQRIYQAFSVEVSLKDFFAAQTIRALGRLIAAARPEGEAIPLAPEAASYPVSPVQGRLWRLDRLGVAPTAYNLGEALELRGPLDPDALEAAFRDLVARHEALRTTFDEEPDGTARQIVHPVPHWILERRDLRDAPDSAADSLAAGEAGHRFDLRSGPLMRVVLARLPDADGAERHLLLFTIHHIVADVWSLGVLVRDLAASYAARRQGRAPDLAPLPLQLRDATTWQAARLADGQLEADRAYWRERFAEPVAPLALPTDRPRPPVQTFAGTTQRFSLPVALSRGLDDLARRQGSTRAALLIALTKALLHRYSGQTDLVVGSPVAGRTHPALADQIGYYVDTLALRDRVSPENSFADLLGQVTATLRDGLAHQAYPFDALVQDLAQDLALERDMSRSALFDVMVVPQGFTDTDLSLDGVSVVPFGRQNAWTFSRFDLVFHVQEEEGALLLDLNYNTDLFDADRIARMGGHFGELARAAIEDADWPLGRLNLLSPEEAATVAAFAQGPRDPRPATTIVAAFAEAVRLHPDRPALIDAEGRSTSYRALGQAADRLGRHLVAAHGLAPGDRVAVLAERSAESVLALLAVMTAGGVYVPVDPAYPESRVREMLERAGCRLVLQDRADPAAAALAGGRPVEAVAPWLVGDDGTAEPLDASRPQDPAPEDPAYVIFTSGSTGTPKAVVVAHAGFVTMARAQVAAFGIGPQDRVLQFASPSFDASLANIFMALLAGAALVLPTRAAIEETGALRALMRRLSVSVVTLPPTYLRALERAALPGLRVLITAGEAAPVADLCHYAGHLAAFNAYGPTEASVCATIHRVGAAEAGRARLPIGRPLPNTTAHILDAALAPVPVGVPGELHLGGGGLAIGYQGDPERTAELFITHPETGERLYRTGDRAAWNADGTIDCLGRSDEQVKVSGHRIEIGEVEAALRRVPGLRDALVTPVARPEGSTALAAYYCADAPVELWPSVAEFYVYDDVAYGSMAADEGRNQRYREAFARHLPGKTVIDIGTGPVVILARLAIEAGARKVYAVDRLEATARKARETVARLGLSDRIEVIHGDALTLALPEPVDACISEIVGAIGGAEGAARIINGARRFLKDPAAMLPRFSDTCIAALSLPRDRLAPGFSDVAAHYVEKIFAEVGQPFDLRLCLKNLPREAIVSDDGVFEYLDYTREVPLEERHDVALTVTRDCDLTGFLVWLRLGVDADAVVDILDNPGSWLPVYLPVFDLPVAVREGDRIAMSIDRRLCGNGLNADFALDGRVVRECGEAVPFRYLSAHFGGGFRQTPFYDGLFSGDGIPRFETPSPVALRRHLLTVLPAYAVPAFLVPLERMPVTLNGKVDRAALPAPGMVAPAEGRAPQTALESLVLRVWGEVMERRDIGVQDDFFGLGGDSIRAIQIVSRLRQEGWRSEIRDVFQNPTAEQFAAVLRPVVVRADQGPVVGAVPLTPIQRWFLETSERPRHFNQAVVLRADHIDPAAMGIALAEVWRHHDALRARFTKEAEGWRQVFRAPGDPPRLAELPAHDREALGGEAAFAAAASRLQAGFDLDGTPLLAALLDRTGARHRLLLVAHHLVVDAVSWGILLEDLESAYEAALSGAAPRLPEKTHSYRDHAAALATIADTIDWTSRLRTWRQVAPDSASEAPPARVGDALSVRARLPRDLTAALVAEANRAYGTGPEDLLLAALAVALERHSGTRRTLVTLEGHGREYRPADLLGESAPATGRTVGWFTMFHPLELHACADLADTIRTAKDGRRRVPDHGFTWLPMQALPDAPRLRPGVSFNYLGQMGAEARRGGRFAVDWDAPGGALDPEAVRPHHTDVLCLVVDGEMEVGLDLDGARTSREEAQALLSAYRDAIEAVVAHCLSRGEAEVTPSDLTFEGLSLDDLDRLLAE